MHTPRRRPGRPGAPSPSSESYTAQGRRSKRDAVTRHPLPVTVPSSSARRDPRGETAQNGHRRASGKAGRGRGLCTRRPRHGRQEARTRRMQSLRHVLGELGQTADQPAASAHGREPAQGHPRPRAGRRREGWGQRHERTGCLLGDRTFWHEWRRLHNTECMWCHQTVCLKWLKL